MKACVQQFNPCVDPSSGCPLIVVQATKWGGPSDETAKPEAPCRSRCGQMYTKDPSLLKGHKGRTQASNLFCSPSSVSMTSPYECNVFERALSNIIDQSTNQRLTLSERSLAYSRAISPFSCSSELGDGCCWCHPHLQNQWTTSSHHGYKTFLFK